MNKAFIKRKVCILRKWLWWLDEICAALGKKPQTFDSIYFTLIWKEGNWHKKANIPDLNDFGLHGVEDSSRSDSKKQFLFFVIFSFTSLQHGLLYLGPQMHPQTMARSGAPPTPTFARANQVLTWSSYVLQNIIFLSGWRGGCKERSVCCETWLCLGARLHTRAPAPLVHQPSALSLALLRGKTKGWASWNNFFFSGRFFNTAPKAFLLGFQGGQGGENKW